MDIGIKKKKSMFESQINQTLHRLLSVIESITETAVRN